MRSRRPVFTAVLIGMMLVSTAQLFAFAVVAVDIIEELGISKGRLGLLGTANTLVGGLVAPFVGQITDRVGARRAAVLVCLTGSMGLAATAAAPTYLLLVAASMLSGISQGWSNPATNKLIALHVDKGSQGVITGFKQSGVQLAAFLVGATLPTAALAFGWRWGVMMYAIFALVLAVVAAVVLPADPAGAASAPLDRPTARHSVRARPSALVIRVTIYAFLMGTAGGAVGRFLALFAHEDLGFSTRVAGFVAALAGLSGIVARVLVGRAADRNLASMPALAAMAGLAALVGLFLALAPSVGGWILWPIAILMGFGTNAWNTVANLAIIRGVPLEDAGRSSGIMLTGFLGGLAVGSPLAGWAIDAAADYRPTWLATTVLAMVAVAVAAAGHRRPARAGD